MNVLSILHLLDPSMPLVQKLDTGDVTTCKAIGQVANIPGMDKWCTDNCPNNCPETYCSCKFRCLITFIEISFDIYMYKHIKSSTEYHILCV